VPDIEPGAKGFAVQAKRWVVKRTIARLNFYQKTAVDYENTVENAQSFLMLANIAMVVCQIKCFTE